MTAALLAQRSPAPARCPAAHVEDGRPCVGRPDAVTIVDRQGGSTQACILHGAVLHASLLDGLVRTGAMPGAAIATFALSARLQPFAFADDGELAELAAADWAELVGRNADCEVA